ncbi:MAG: hypothetical protein JXR48_00330 [Candidatus Delongbacteria bacterium]|nr:hypothetical protein [Candidatus Delongbacteria bacterium]MBN2833390.1 hypothetical protein [Candidatus Delongbacteria bacterium]
MRTSYIILLSLTLFFSCTDLFDTRTPADPQGMGQVNELYSIKEFMDNFKSSLSESNKETYLLMFSEFSDNTGDYQFVPVNDVDSILFLDWDVNNEKNFIDDFFNKFYFKEFNLSPSEFEETIEDSTNIIFEYNGVIVDVETGIDFNFSGDCDLKLKKISGLWFLTLWKDSRKNQTDVYSFTSVKKPYIN